MSKKRILSNGHSSYWKDDLSKSTIIEQVFLFQMEYEKAMFGLEAALSRAKAKSINIYCGKSLLNDFDNAIKQEFNKNK